MFSLVQTINHSEDMFFDTVLCHQSCSQIEVFFIPLFFCSMFRFFIENPFNEKPVIAVVTQFLLPVMNLVNAKNHYYYSKSYNVLQSKNAKMFDMGLESQWVISPWQIREVRLVKHL